MFTKVICLLTGNPVQIVARIMLSIPFFVGGINKVLSFQGVVGWTASKGVPFAQIAVGLAIILELLGPIILVIGRKTPATIVALLLSGFCVLTAFVFHDFWTLSGGEARGEIIAFEKNLALAGGLLLTAALSQRK